MLSIFTLPSVGISRVYLGDIVFLAFSYFFLWFVPNFPVTILCIFAIWANVFQHISPSEFSTDSLRHSPQPRISNLTSFLIFKWQMCSGPFITPFTHSATTWGYGSRNYWSFSVEKSCLATCCGVYRVLHFALGTRNGICARRSLTSATHPSFFRPIFTIPISMPSITAMMDLLSAAGCWYNNENYFFRTGVHAQPPPFCLL